MTTPKNVCEESATGRIPARWKTGKPSQPEPPRGRRTTGQITKLATGQGHGFIQGGGRDFLSPRRRREAVQQPVDRRRRVVRGDRDRLERRPRDSGQEDRPAKQGLTLRLRARRLVLRGSESRQHRPRDPARPRRGTPRHLDDRGLGGGERGEIEDEPSAACVERLRSRLHDLTAALDTATASDSSPRNRGDAEVIRVRWASAKLGVGASCFLDRLPHLVRHLLVRREQRQGEVVVPAQPGVVEHAQRSLSTLLPAGDGVVVAVAADRLDPLVPRRRDRAARELPVICADDCAAPPPTTIRIIRMRRIARVYGRLSRFERRRRRPCRISLADDHRSGSTNKVLFGSRTEWPQIPVNRSPPCNSGPA